MTDRNGFSAPNLDPGTVDGFGFEWSRFDQSGVPRRELEKTFLAYFSEFPWDRIPSGAVGFDLGCGTGRWASFVAPRVGRLHCIDASSEAIEVARRTLAQFTNCVIERASVDSMSLVPGTMDFGYSLGVLHHVPDTAAGIRACVKALKPGAPFLIYLYYALDGRPFWFRLIWRFSDVGRRLISKLPSAPRALVSDLIAAAVYWPLSRAAALLERLGARVDSLPLSYYRKRSFATMRTDALDRFGTPLEKRFSRAEIRRMLEDAGLVQVRFREAPPYWCAVGFRSDGSSIV